MEVVTGIAVRIGPCSAQKKDDTVLICSPFLELKTCFYVFEPPSYYFEHNEPNCTLLHRCKFDMIPLGWIKSFLIWITIAGSRHWSSICMHWRSISCVNLTAWINTSLVLFASLPVSSVCNSCVFIDDNNNILVNAAFCLWKNVFDAGTEISASLKLSLARWTQRWWKMCPPWCVTNCQLRGERCTLMRGYMGLSTLILTGKVVRHWNGLPRRW